VLEVPRPTERRFVLRPEAAELIDGLLARVARGAGALDVALGSGLRTLEAGGGPLRLGYSSLGDYARERLGLPESTSRRLARLSAGLHERPLLEAAVRAGEVTLRKAQVVLGVARGPDEERWVARARGETVRALAVAVRDEAGGDGSTAAAAAEETREPLVPLEIELSDADRSALREALSLAGKTLGATAPPWQRVEAICQEFLGSHPEPERLRLEDLDPEAAAAASGALQGTPWGRGSEWWDAARLALEEETERWSCLERLDPLPRRSWATRWPRATCTRWTRACASGRRCARAGTRWWATWACSCACWGSGARRASPRSATTARSAWACRSARSSSASRSSAACTRCRRSARRSRMGG
jgi:hypothetical protein